MQAIEVPEHSDNEIHIVLKRDIKDPNEPRYVTEKMFLQFSSIMQKGMQEILQKMTNIQNSLTAIEQNQQHENEEQRQNNRHFGTEEIQVVDDNDEHHHESIYHNAPAMMQDSVHSQEEVHLLEEQDSGEGITEEYILDVEEPPLEVPEEGEVTDEYNNGKRRNSITPKAAPKIKRIKNTIEPNQESEEFIHIVESIAACESIQSNADSKESIVRHDPLDIKIIPDPSYGTMPVTEEMDFDFPITTLESLKHLNNLLGQDERVVECLKHKLIGVSIAADYNFQKALQRLLADSLMHQLNWQGQKGKFRMKDMPLFGQILYQTWFQHIDFDQYEEILKIITKKAHKRYSKSMERQRHRSQGGPNRLVQKLMNVKYEKVKNEISP